MNLTLSNIIYSDLANSQAKLVQTLIPVEGQTYEYLPQDMINAQNYTLSKRNSSGAYILPTEKEKLYLNFIPIKTLATDQNINDYIERQFTYFVPDEIIPPDPFTLPDGTIFRCVSKDSTPEPKESYVYWIVEEGMKKLIPNYKTLEVMLFERNQNLLSVRIVQENQCNDILEGDPIPDKSGSWSDDMKDQTNFEALKGLQGSVKSGQALAEGAKAAILGDLRYHGAIDWQAIEDRGRVPFIPYHALRMADFMLGAKARILTRLLTIALRRKPMRFSALNGKRFFKTLKRNNHAKGN